MLFKDVTNFQTLQTWLGHNATCYYNLNMFIHALLYCLWDLPDFGVLQQVTTCYNPFSKESISRFFINLMVTHGKPLQIASNLTKLSQNPTVVTNWFLGDGSLVFSHWRSRSLSRILTLYSTRILQDYHLGLICSNPGILGV